MSKLVDVAAPPRALATVLRFTLAGGLAGLWLGALDLMVEGRNLGDVRWSASWFLLSGTTLLAGALGCAWSIARLLVWRFFGSSAPRWLATVIVAAFVAYPMAHLTETLLAGDWVRRQAWTGVARVATPLIGSFFLGFLLLLPSIGPSPRGGRARWWLLLSFALLALGTLLDAVDRGSYRGQYPLLHTVAWCLALLACAKAFELLCVRRQEVTTAFACLGLGLLAAGVFLAFRGDDVRFALVRRTHQGSRLFWVLDQVVPRAASDIPVNAAFAAERRAARRRAQEFSKTLDGRLGGDRRTWNLLWITVDTLRADHVHAYGYPRPTTKRLDRLAREGVLFSRAYAQYPITHFSFQSMFYGRYPKATPLYRKSRGLPDLPEGRVTLAELLSREGFVTVSVPAVSEASLLGETYEVMATGFQHVNPDRESTRLSADVQAECAIAFLGRARASRWFLWLHMMDPHYPYVLHQEHAFGDTSKDLYDSEIAWTDAHIGRVLDALDASGLSDRTIVVVNSDHGESFGEHRTDFHGSTLYDEQIRVPLILRVPRIASRRIEPPVENVDVMPTVLDLLGVAHTLPLQGDSLASWMLDGAPPDAVGFAYAQLPPARGPLTPGVGDREALVMGGFKLHVDAATRVTELYDLTSDPNELRNEATKRPELVRESLGALKVLEAECREVNAPRDVLDPTARLRTRWRDATVASRSVLLSDGIAQRAEGVREFLLELLEEKKAAPLVLSLLLLHGPELLGKNLESHARRALESGGSWGEVATGVELFLHPGVEINDASTLDALASCVGGPPALARRAAWALALRGDVRGRPRLASDAASKDPWVRLVSASGRLLLGDTEAIPEVRLGLARGGHSMPLRAAALFALAKVRADEALLDVLDVAKDPYSDHWIKSAAKAYADAISKEAATALYLTMLRGWDPALVQSVGESLERRYGKTEASMLQEAARALANAKDLLEQGLGKPALKILAAVTRAGQDPGLYAFVHLYAARAAKVAGDGPASSLHVDILKGVGSPWARLAADLEGPLDGGAARVSRWAPTFAGAAVPGGEATFELELENTGSRPLFGGQWQEGLRMYAEWHEGDRLAATRRPVLNLAEQGIEPGGRRSVTLPTTIPYEAGTYGIRIRSTRGELLPAPALADVSLQVVGADLQGLDPTGVTFHGKDLLERWWFHPGLLRPTLEDDGAVSFLPTQPDAWILSPVLTDLGRGLEVELVYEVHGRGRGTVELLCSVAFVPLAFEPERELRVPVVADGSRVTLPGVLATKNGRGVRQIRIRPVSGTELFRIHSLRLKAL